MTKTLSMVSHINYNLNANESFITFLTSKWITWFIGIFTLKMKSQSIAHLLNGSKHVYWIWDLEDEAHSIWDLWTSGLQEIKGNGSFKIGRAGSSFRSGTRKSRFYGQAVAPARIFRPRKVWGGLNVPPFWRTCCICRKEIQSNPMISHLFTNKVVEYVGQWIVENSIKHIICAYWDWDIFNHNA